MSQDATVLIVDAQHFHPSLEEQLGARQVYVEHAGAADALRIASVLVPDLVVIPGKSGADTLTVELHALRPPVPTLVVADRAQVKKLRALDLPLAALVPHDLPTAAIAHRIATMARRAAHGEISPKLHDGDRKSAPGAPAVQAAAVSAGTATATAAADAATAVPATTASAAAAPAHAAIAREEPAAQPAEKAAREAPASKSGEPSVDQGERKVVRDKQPRAIKPLPAVSAPRDVRTAPLTEPTASLKNTLPGVAVPPQVAEIIAARKDPSANKGHAPAIAHTDLSSKSLRPGQFVPLPLSDID